MPLVYAFIARGNTVLADCALISGNFSTLAVQCLERCPTDGTEKFTYKCDRHTFNFLVSNGYTFLCVADDASGRALPYGFLERIREDFARSWAEKGKTAAAHTLDRALGPKLKEQMEYCMAHPEEVSNVRKVQKQVDEVKDVMVKNIEKILERGEKIEVLADKSEGLSTMANQFAASGKKLRMKMWWQNMKIKIFLAVLVVLVVLIIFFIACFSGGNCFK